MQTKALRCLVAGIGLSSTVHGQEALRSALSVDAVVQGQNATAVELLPDQPHLGPVQYTLGTYLGAQVDDNVNTSQTNPEADTILRGGVNVGLVWPATEQTEVKFDMDAGYAAYVRHTRDNGVEVAPGSALSWNLGFEDGSLTLFDQVDYSQEVITVAAVSGSSGIPRLDNTVGVRSQWQPRRWQLEAGYSHNDYLSNDPSYQYLNRASEYFFMRDSRLLAEDTRVGAEASASFTRYQLPIQSDNTSYSVGLFAKWTATHFLSATVRGGPTFYSFLSPSGTTSGLPTYYFDLGVTHQLTEFISHNLSVNRGVNLGYSQGNNYTEQLTANYGVNWSATQKLSFSAKLAYEVGQQPLYYGSVTENFDRIGFSLGSTYKITEKLSASLYYWHWRRSSDIPGNSYTDNSAGLELRHTF